MTTTLTPARIFETAAAFWPAKTLLSAVELGVFTELAGGPKANAELAKSLGIRADRSLDFFDALVALGFLDRKGRRPGRALHEHCRNRLFPRPQQADLRGRHAGDAERAPVRLLERSHGRPPYGKGPKRVQERR